MTALKMMRRKNQGRGGRKKSLKGHSSDGTGRG